jgi:hypothetical protein
MASEIQCETSLFGHHLTISTKDTCYTDYHFHHNENVCGHIYPRTNGNQNSAFNNNAVRHRRVFLSMTTIRQQIIISNTHTAYSRHTLSQLLKYVIGKRQAIIGAFTLINRNNLSISVIYNATCRDYHSYNMAIILTTKQPDPEICGHRFVNYYDLIFFSL